MIYYYYFNQNMRTFANLDMAMKNAIDDNVLKIRDSLGGEYFL